MRQYAETLILLRGCKSTARYRVALTQAAVVGARVVPFRDRTRVDQTTDVVACGTCLPAIAPMDVRAKRQLDRTGKWTDNSLPRYPVVVTALDRGD